MAYGSGFRTHKTPMYTPHEDVSVMRHFSDDEKGFPWFGSRAACIKGMSQASSELQDSHTLHCPADYDRLSVMCWPPTSAGQIARHPCTADGFLNPHMFAWRTCLPNGKWYVNASFDRHPYTDFTDCLTPWMLSEEEKLRKLAGDKIVRMLNSLDSHRRLYISLYVVAIFLLAASIAACFIVLVQVNVSQHKLRSFRRRSFRSSTSSAVFNTKLPWPHMPHALLAVAAIVLLVDNIVSIILSSSGWPDYLINCRVYKSIDVLSMLIFYQCLLGYVILAVSRILRYRFKRRHVRIIVILCIILTSVIVGLELISEVVIFPTHYCGFGNLQGNFHWLFTGPKYLIIMCTICLAVCNGFGAFCLHQPSLGSARERRRPPGDKDGGEEQHIRPGEEQQANRRLRDWWFERVKVRKAEDVMTLRHIRQGSISVVITIVFSLLRELMVVLLHFITAKNVVISPSVANAVAPDSKISGYASLYALITCLHGIVFAIAMCFCDVRVIATLTQCFKSRSCGWKEADNGRTSCPQSPSPSHTLCCCPGLQRQGRKKKFSYLNRRGGSDIEGLEKNSPSREVITPILGFSTPSPQHSRCLPVKGPLSRGTSKGLEDSSIALSENPKRKTSQRPALHPTIETASTIANDRAGNDSDPDYPLQYR